MPHLYAKDPPRFATDPHAWDYTRNRIEGNTGLPYDQWEGKHFAGAAAMYKNVVKKYGDSLANGVVTVPKECVDCGQTEVHYDGDYVCKSCRDAIENAGSYKEAAATITRPESMDAIREQLYKALGHDKKDAKKGRVPSTTPVGIRPDGSPVVARQHDQRGQPPTGAGLREEMDEPTARQEADRLRGEIILDPVRGVSRNYKAMGADKLARSIEELEAGAGEAVRKAEAKGEDVMDHLEAALRAQQEMGQ